jgi:hypothetical protein
VARLEREVRDVPVGHPEPAFVVADDRGELAEVPEEVLPDRAAPVVLQMTQPAGDDDDGRTAPVDRPCEPRAVTPSAEAHILVRAVTGASVGQEGREFHGTADLTHRCAQFGWRRRRN